jgi:hypothetical protein
MYKKIRYTLGQPDGFRWLITYAYTFFLIIFLYPIYKIRKKRIGYLRTDAIGHLAYNTRQFFELVENTEYFLNINKIKLIGDRATANKFLLDEILKVKPKKLKFKKSSRLLNNYGRWNFDRLVDKYKFASEVIIDVERGSQRHRPRKKYAYYQDYNESKVLNLNYPGLLIPVGNFRISNFLADHGLNPSMPIIGVIDRDSAFSTGVPLRDTRIADLNELCLRLSKAGYQVVRMGNLRESKVDPSIDGVLDYPFLKCKSAELDIELCRRLDFYVTWDTGLNTVPMIFNKPTYIISMDFLPWLPGHSGKILNNPSVKTVGVDGTAMNLIDLIYRTKEYDFTSKKLTHLNLYSAEINFEDIMYDINFFVSEERLSNKLLSKEKEYTEDLIKALEWLTTHQLTSKTGEVLYLTKYLLDLRNSRNYVSPSFLKKYRPSIK